MKNPPSGGFFYNRFIIRPIITGITMAGREFTSLNFTRLSIERPIAIMVIPPTPEIFAKISGLKIGARKPARIVINPS